MAKKPKMRERERDWGNGSLVRLSLVKTQDHSTLSGVWTLRHVIFYGYFKKRCDWLNY